MKIKNKSRLKVLNLPFFMELMICRLDLLNSDSSWKYDENNQPVFKRNGFYTANAIGTWVEIFYKDKWYVFTTTYDQFVSEMRRIEQHNREIQLEDINHLRRIAAKHKVIEKLLRSFLFNEHMYDLCKNIRYHAAKCRLMFIKQRNTPNVK